jgi:hypothetical protein
LLLVSCKQSKTKNENIPITYTVSYECENACYFMERTQSGGVSEQGAEEKI